MTLDIKESIKTEYAEHGVDVAFLNITATQLKKSIMDATKPVRELFQVKGLHDYSTQEQGTQAKVTKKAYFVTGKNDVTEETVTMYRPTSGNGDPRIWFTNLKTLVEAGDVLTVITDGTDIYAFSIKHIDVASIDVADFFNKADESSGSGLSFIGRMIEACANINCDNCNMGLSEELTHRPFYDSNAPLCEGCYDHMAGKVETAV